VDLKRLKTAVNSINREHPGIGNLNLLPLSHWGPDFNLGVMVF
jgi:hypothetical protein